MADGPSHPYLNSALFGASEAIFRADMERTNQQPKIGVTVGNMVLAIGKNTQTASIEMDDNVLIIHEKYISELIDILLAAEHVLNTRMKDDG